MAPGEVPPDAIDARGMSSDVFGPDEVRACWKHAVRLTLAPACPGAPSQSGCPPANGQLEKRNARGRWQSRYFVVGAG